MNWKTALRASIGQFVLVWLAFAVMAAMGSFFVQMVVRSDADRHFGVAVGEMDRSVRAYLRDPLVFFDKALGQLADILDKGGSVPEAESFLETAAGQLKEHPIGLAGTYVLYGEIHGVFLDPLGRSLTIAELKAREWFEEDPGGFSEPYWDEATGELLMSRARPIFGKSGVSPGVLCMDANLEWLRKYSEAFVFTKGGYGFITNGKGMILSHPEGGL